MIKYLFWDFDGTLFDTYKQMVPAFRHALLDLEVDDVEIDDYDIYLTMRRHSLGTAVSKYAAFFGVNKDRLKEIEKKYENKDVLKAKPFVGVEGVLKFNLTQNGENFLLTHRDDLAEDLLAKFNLKELFSDAVTANQLFPRKPNPESLNWLIKHNNVQRNKSAMIGDRQLDIQAGHNANISGFLFDPDAIISNDGTPEFRFNQMPELLKYLKKHK